MIDGTIFISIAAYREFDLVTTVREAMRLAEHPERLRFCICWQHAEHESLEGLDADPRIDIIDIPHLESRGVCWARHLIQQRYRGETYALQMDGHHRFVEHWDRKLIDMLEGLKTRGIAKPVLTGYLPSFDPHNDPAGRNQALWLYGFDRFETAGVVFMRPYTPAERPCEPVPTAFWSAHFSFSEGRFHEEVVIDPNGYFHAEEISTGVRAWTHGYDFFTPHETVMWHEYSRKGRICHWNDHDDWGRRNARAIARYRAQFGLDGTPRRDFAPYGFGTERSLDDFQRFAGICFDCRGAERATIEHRPPPVPSRDLTDGDWRAQLLYSHSLVVHIAREQLEQDDPTLFLALFANSADGTEVHRTDYPRERIDELLRTQSGAHIEMLIAFFSAQCPAVWTAWVGSATRGWLQRSDGQWPAPTGPALESEDAAGATP